MLLLCTCHCCAVLLLLLLLLLHLRYVFAADPREHGYYASHPLSVMCLRILKAERQIHLLRKLYEYRLVNDILFGISAEVSCQRTYRTIRTRTLCCCFCQPRVRGTAVGTKCSSSPFRWQTVYARGLKFLTTSFAQCNTDCKGPVPTLV